MKKVLISVCAVVMVALVIIGIISSTKTVRVTTRSDLTQLMGYDFTNSKISAVYTEDNGEGTNLCIVLEDDKDRFMMDDFVKNTGFPSDYSCALWFSILKKSFPNVIDFEYEQTTNRGYNMKDYVFKSLFAETAVPCSVCWFSTEIDSEEKVVMYSFFSFPVEISSKHLNIVQ